MKDKQNKKLIYTFGGISLACLIASIVLIFILLSKMLSYGTTTFRIWGMVGLGIAFVICVATLGVCYAFLKTDKESIKVEELDENKK